MDERKWVLKSGSGALWNFNPDGIQKLGASAPEKITNLDKFLMTYDEARKLKEYFISVHNVEWVRGMQVIHIDQMPNIFAEAMLNRMVGR